MKSSEILASIGVAMLLIAFLLNLYKKLNADARLYRLLNFIGAAICCMSSYLINFYPFVVLEGAWAFVALVSLFNVFKTSEVLNHMFHVEHMKRINNRR